jgi:hypothetical protein
MSRLPKPCLSLAGGAFTVQAARSIAAASRSPTGAVSAHFCSDPTEPVRALVTLLVPGGVTADTITEPFLEAVGEHSALTPFLGRTDYDIDAFLAVASDMICLQVDRGGARYQAVPKCNMQDKN